MAPNTGPSLTAVIGGNRTKRQWQMKGAWRPEWLRWELLNWDALVSGCGWTLSQSGTSKEVMTVISGHDRHLWACIGMTGRLEPRVAVDWDSLWGCLWFVPLQEPLRRQWHHWGAYDRCGAAIAGTSLVSLACLGESSGIWTAVAGTSGMEWPWWEKQKGATKRSMYIYTICTHPSGSSTARHKYCFLKPRRKTLHKACSPRKTQRREEGWKRLPLQPARRKVTWETPTGVIL